MTELYADFANNVFANMVHASPVVTHATDVAEAVWKAATDSSSPIRIPAGNDAVALAAAL